MLTVNVDMMILLIALCFMCVSSNDESNLENSCELYSEGCETHTLSARPGSSVLLPCVFSTSSNNWVSWVHMPSTDLVRLNSSGRIKFVDPKFGRVKVFPNQGSQRNFSIYIDEIKNSDLGCYRCKQEQGCRQVELVTESGMQHEEMLLWISVGVAAFILLIVGGYCCSKCISCCNNRTQDYVINPVDAGATAPPQETGSVPVHEEQRGADNLVYENDNQGPANLQVHPTRHHQGLPGVLPDVDRTQHTQSASGIYPNLTQFSFERMESQRTKRRFHAELFSRFRQASLSRHYYVNQHEIRRQQAMAAQVNNHHGGGLGQKKVKENHEFKNPIYNRSTEQLNHL